MFGAGHEPNGTVGRYGPVDTSDRAGRWLRPLGLWVASIAFGTLTLATVALLLAWDAVPQVFPRDAHALLGSAPLALIAVSFVVYTAARHPSPFELVKMVVLAAAFLFWAANQLFSESPHAVLLNDLAIALFVLDVFLSIVGMPPALGRSASAVNSVPLAGSSNGSAPSSGIERPSVRDSGPHD
jgi:hypothetical protein